MIQDLTDIIDVLAQNLYKDIALYSGVDPNLFPMWVDLPAGTHLTLRERSLELLTGVLPLIQAGVLSAASQDERFSVEAQVTLSSMAWAIQWDLAEGNDL